MHNFHCRANENIKNYANKITFLYYILMINSIKKKNGDNIFSFFLVSLFPYFEMCVLNEKKRQTKMFRAFFFIFNIILSMEKRPKKEHSFLRKETLTNFT